MARGKGGESGVVGARAQTGDGGGFQMRWALLEDTSQSKTCLIRLDLAATESSDQLG